VNNLPAHGTYSRYIRHACRCNLCRDAGRRYRLRLGYDRVNGTRRRIDNTQARAHTERLVAHDWTHEQIAAAAGLSAGSIHDLYTGRYKTIARTSAEAILNVRLDQAPPIPRRLIDATGTRRRLQALMVLGYTLPDIASRVGAGISSLQQTTDGRWTSIRAVTATKVERVYRQLSTLPAPQSRFAEQARNQAMAEGWHGPMAWDNIDDPRCEPDADAPTAPRSVHADDVAKLAARGLDDEEIGRRLGVSPRTVLRARAAHDIPAGVAA
jgi:AraC-like DNA-binding protein